MAILITGTAGFIGFHLAKRLLEEGHNVIGIDNLNNYYDPALKIARNEVLIATAKKTSSDYLFVKANIEEYNPLENVFKKYNPKKVINLAAQAGVRYSITNPSAYIQSNIVGFSNILELSRHYKVDNLIYASSSSVYGGNKIMPFSENQEVNHPVSLYAASKRSNELMAHTYSHLYGLPTTGLRFFTVYGPWGRPDMALFLFTKAMLSNEPIKVFNNGKMSRDFTYIDDIIESIIRLIDKPAKVNSNFDYNSPKPSSSWCPFKIFNIGNSSPLDLLEFIEAIESELGVKAKKEFLPMQPGDVSSTFANTEAIEQETGFRPKTSVKEGVYNFINWYRHFYKI